MLANIKHWVGIGGPLAACVGCPAPAVEFGGAISAAAATAAAAVFAGALDVGD